MKVIAVIPAAGIGQRMGASIPKQYLTLFHQTILEHSTYALLADTRVQQVYLALHPDDHYFSHLSLAKEPRVVSVIGGETRAVSVLNALRVAALEHDSTTLVAVHDAARPGLSKDFLARLLNAAIAAPKQGVVAAVPAWDTIKQQDGAQVSTLDRSKIWHAFTPQVFQLGVLIQALEVAITQNIAITDEASALELLGVQPHLLVAEQQLRKITCPEDLVMVKALLIASKDAVREGVKNETMVNASPQIQQSLEGKQTP